MPTRNKGYQLLTIEKIAEWLQQCHIEGDHVVMRERFAINLDMVKANMPHSLINMVKKPFCINDNRLLRFLAGTAHLEVNLAEYELTAGDMLLVREGSYLEVKAISEDAKAEVMAFVPDQYPTNLALFRQSVFKVHPEPEVWNEVSHLFYTLYSFAKNEPYRPEVVEPLVQALVNYVLGLSDATPMPTNSTELLFQHFIEQLTAHKGKHPVTYYANLLCVTPQHLSRTISLVSGKTVVEWINKAVILDARILLRGTTQSISEISDTLNFPNDSFFCRFFKRETGYTPSQYRKAKR